MCLELWNRDHYIAFQQETAGVHQPDQLALWVRALMGFDAIIQLSTGFGSYRRTADPFVQTVPAAFSYGRDERVIGNQHPPARLLGQRDHSPNNRRMGRDGLARIAGLQ